MPKSISIMFSFFVIMFIVFGVLIKYYKCYWLISGYNMASKERKAKVDIEGLGKFIGDFCFTMSGVFAAAAISSYFKFSTGLIIALFSLFIIIPYVLIKAQKYDPLTQIPGGKTKPVIVGVIIFLTFILMLVVGLGIYGTRVTTVNVNKSFIEIKGPYSIKYLMSDIESIELKDSVPEVINKMDGFDMGGVRKGNFNLKGIGGARIYINSSEAPYIYLKKGGKYIIINLKHSEDTKELYNKLISNWKNK